MDAPRVVVYEDGKPLTEGVDYVFEGDASEFQGLPVLLNPRVRLLRAASGWRAIEMRVERGSGMSEPACFAGAIC